MTSLGRRETRECAMKLIFQTMLQREDVDDQIERFCEDHHLVDTKEISYFLGVVQGARVHAQDLDELISRHAKGWTVLRMPKVDLAIMRISAYEMMHMADIPASISINEAVELAKKYGDNRSGSFVNGVLGNIFLELYPEGEPTP